MIRCFLVDCAILLDYVKSKGVMKSAILDVTVFLQCQKIVQICTHLFQNNKDMENHTIIENVLTKTRKHLHPCPIHPRWVDSSEVVDDSTRFARSPSPKPEVKTCETTITPFSFLKRDLRKHIIRTKNYPRKFWIWSKLHINQTVTTATTGTMVEPYSHQNVT